MMVIRGTQLTTFDVAPDGESFSIGVTDERGQPAALILPSDCLNGLLMTLPEMVRRSLQARFRDASMRLVYPVGSSQVEPSAVSGHVIVTLRTPDGFSVSFGFSPVDLVHLWTQSVSVSRKAADIVTN